MGVQVDLIAPRSSLELESSRLAFKYYTNVGNIAVIWHEMNCLIRIPRRLWYQSFTYYTLHRSDSFSWSYQLAIVPQIVAIREGLFQVPTSTSHRRTEDLTHTIKVDATTVCQTY